MKTQRRLWLKIFIASGVIVIFIYLFAPSSLTTLGSNNPIALSQEAASATIQPTSMGNQVKEELLTHKTSSISSSLSSNEKQTITPELQERITAMQQRRPDWQFSNTEVAAAVKRTTSWSPSEEIPRELPLKPEEFTDGRQFIELDSLKIETLMPGDNINVRVDNSAKNYQVIIDRVEKHDYNSISWHGHIQGDDGQKYSVSFTRGEHLTVGGLDTPDGHYVLQGHGDKGWIASSQLLFKADTSVSDAINPADVDPNYSPNQDPHHNH